MRNTLARPSVRKAAPLRRATRNLLIGLALLGVLIGIGIYALGGFNSEINLYRLRADRQDYTRAAEAVVRAESPRGQERHFRYHDRRSSDGLAEGPYLFYLRYEGNDFVYFPLHNDVTLSDGLMYSRTGAAPPTHDTITVVSHPEKQWFVVAFNNGILELGRIEP
jgi:hypothetical protein